MRGPRGAGRRTGRARPGAPADLPLDRPAPARRTARTPARPDLSGRLRPAARTAGGTGTADALAGVIGRTRLEALLALAEEHTTRGLARRLRVSEATASAHTAALRAAGLVASERAGRSVLHRRTALGGLLVRGRAGEGSVPSSP
ncbi:helix-turn-helix domain-containing protein [Streptomyces lavendulocolor]|uniref:helix-turn-helix domain-containing protein n=1 Tax=Streptomyces lavendulocolor TaxID=67316 RepID=UPI0031D2D3F4